MNTIDLVMSKFHVGKMFELQHNVDKYMRCIVNEPLLISSFFVEVKPDSRVSSLNPQNILFPVSGAT